MFTDSRKAVPAAGFWIETLATFGVGASYHGTGQLLKARHTCDLVRGPGGPGTGTWEISTCAHRVSP